MWFGIRDGVASVSVSLFFFLLKHYLKYEKDNYYQKTVKEPLYPNV